MTGIPALAWGVGFVVLCSLPVWAAAKVAGAANATLPRSALALVVGTALAAASLAVAGGWALLLAPLAYLLTFKYVLDTSFLGAIVLAVIALAGYAGMAKLIGGSFGFSS